MRVLIACEFSGTVRDAFIARGHDAVSCDLLPTEKLGPHYQIDIMELLVKSEMWDLIIAHPDCTTLTVAGNSTYGEGKPRYAERLSACEWTKNLWELCKLKAKRVCFENPVGVLRRLAGMPKPTYVHPWQHGHPEQKKTCLFLHNLDALQPTNNVYEEMMLLPKNQRERLHYLPPSPLRWKIRSTTFPGIANAMADQWGRQ
jgi:hypothetical protein